VLAAEVAERGAVAGTRVEVVSTDGFLRPNAWLSDHGLLPHKGFPETYDVDALRTFVEAVHAGSPDIPVPVYSHILYDVVPDQVRVLPRADVVIVEGVNALSALAGRVELGIYLHAPEEQLEAWFIERFHALCAEAADDEASFYRTFAGMDLDQIDAIAHTVWRDVNLVNHREHIEPSRAHADCTVVKGAGHEVTAIEVREHDATTD
jgi:type I pantothenate kinase